jgi:hypothetical protein
LSSAILYVAIVVIWAAVLIPRWLRRDSAAPASGSVPALEAQGQVTVDLADEEQASPVRSPSRRSAVPPASRSRPEEPPRERQLRPGDDRDDRDVDDDRAHRRAVSARRRLLLMLVVLDIGSAVLAGAKMAAWWVILPPAVMLLSYLLVLRAAVKADAEQRAAAWARRAEAARVPVRPPAPVARVIAMPTASAASAAPEPAEDGIYDQYADAKLRAVGD